ncbi:methyl-accepting chemotaxis protein [Fontibacillus panacisegetis]|uniref:Methyl-accepting chemotaxis protein n=1 Tax=Fontibacillus panacisegetis TaxID=670482 RepID=A0A1G7J8B9_9BACL|nr:HAMP domain-containing methyl-accepting chemotaxis protein [Fontibacillus panacisegetis]SDF21170.1 methyl-accepting chemotaxis protein [Fontibacillus panacisegetis]
MKMIQNMKIASKIRLLSISFFIFLIVIGTAGITQIYSVNAKLEELNNSRLIPIVELEQIKSDMESTRSLANSYMDASDDTERSTIQEELKTYQSSIKNGLSPFSDEAEVNNVFTLFDTYSSALEQFVERFSSGKDNLGGQPPAEPAAQANPTENKGDDSGTGENNPSAPQNGGPTEMATLDQSKNDLIKSMDAWIDKHIQAAQHTYEDSKVVYKTTTVSFIVLLLISALVTVVLSIFITRTVVNPVAKVTAKLKEISQNNGDLTGRIDYDSKDELGELSSSFDAFVAKLQAMISEIITSTGTIYTSSEILSEVTGNTTASLQSVSTTISEIAEATIENAAVAEETTASLTEMAKFSESTAVASKRTADTSKKVKEAAQSGAARIEDITSSMNDIDFAAQSVSETIYQLNESSKTIGDISSLISGISAQTNLLALNAAIEAARAGEAGRGFSVVADEIRKLADESNVAAQEIARMVSENQKKTITAVTSTKEVTDKILLGVQKSAEANDSIVHILDSIGTIVTQIDQIDYDNEQQANSSREMEQALQNIAESTNDIASGTEQINASIQEQLSTMNEIDHTADSLSQMAKKLREMTGGFRV